MNVSVIDAIINLVKNPVHMLTREYKSRNRANNAGDALEEYTKDLFAGTFACDEFKRLERQSAVFSYLGNNSNPPEIGRAHV